MIAKRPVASMSMRGFGPVGLALALALAPAPTAAVVLDDENRIEVVLKDGTKVVLVGELESPTGAIPNQPLPDFEAVGRMFPATTEAEKKVLRDAARLPAPAEQRLSAGALSVALPQNGLVVLEIAAR